MQVLIVDGANVIGSRPDGWWHDRPGAALRLCEQLSTAGLPYDEIVLVLEGAARRGNPAEQEGCVRTVHAAGSGDDAVVQEATQLEAGRHAVTVVTADQVLRRRVRAAGATARGPDWLLDRL